VGGAFLQQEYASTFRGARLIVRQLLGHDDQRGVFVQFQLHEGGGAPTRTRHLEGAFSNDGTVLTLAGDTFDSFTGGPVRLRTVTRVVDEDHFTVEEWFMEPGEREELVVVLHHQRKASCQPAAVGQARCPKDQRREPL
jgi:hypothetical protein